MIRLAVNNIPGDLSGSFLNSIAQKASNEIKTDGIIELNFVTRDDIRELNREYRGKDTETDVLSFELKENEIAGQIFICYDIAVEQGKDYGWTTENEIALLLSHGLLHIDGYAHKNDRCAEEMLEAENKILKSLNLREYETKS